MVDENEKPIPLVNISILGRQTVVTTNDTGYFKITVPADKAFALIFSYTGKKTEQRNFLLNENEEEVITIRLELGKETLEEVIIKDNRDRFETGLIRPNPKSVLNLPSAVMSLKKLFALADIGTLVDTASDS